MNFKLTIFLLLVLSSASNVSGMGLEEGLKVKYILSDERIYQTEDGDIKNTIEISTITSFTIEVDSFNEDNMQISYTQASYYRDWLRTESYNPDVLLSIIQPYISFNVDEHNLNGFDLLLNVPYYIKPDFVQINNNIESSFNNFYDYIEQINYLDIFETNSFQFNSQNTFDKVTLSDSTRYWNIEFDLSNEITLNADGVLFKHTTHKIKNNFAFDTNGFLLSKNYISNIEYQLDGVKNKVETKQSIYQDGMVNSIINQSTPYLSLIWLLIPLSIWRKRIVE